MSPTHDANDPVAPVPQFDRAEFDDEGSGIPFCRRCKASIPDVYYDVNGNVVCPDCHARMIRPRRRWLRPIKAFVLGSIAAAVGAGVYRMVTVGTGWHFSLVAIVVGYMVGGAVRSGSDDRGGLFYQLLAAFLTYSAIVGFYVPEAWQAITSAPDEAREARKAAEKKAGADAETRPDRSAKAKPAEDTGRPKAGARPVAVATRPAVKAKDQANVEPTAEQDRAAKLRERLPRGILGLLFLLGMMLLYALLLLGLIFSIPVFAGIQSPVLLFIFAVGLWQAWKTNTFTEVVITGPYRVRR